MNLTLQRIEYKIVARLDKDSVDEPYPQLVRHPPLAFAIVIGLVIDAPPRYTFHAYLFDDFDSAPGWRFLLWGNLYALIPLGALVVVLWLPYQLYAALGAPLALLPDPAWTDGGRLIVGGLIIGASILLHELLHALALIALGYRPILSYRGGFLYASIRPGARLTRRAYLIMVRTPLIAMTLVGAALLIILPIAIAQIILIALLLNGAASVGDLWVARRAAAQAPDAVFGIDADAQRIAVYLPET